MTAFPLTWQFGVTVIESDLIRLVYPRGEYDPLEGWHKSDDRLYLDLASLDETDPGQVEAFTSRYGLLGLSVRKQRREELRWYTVLYNTVDPSCSTRQDANDGQDVRPPFSPLKDEQREESLAGFQAAVRKLRNCLILWSALDRHDRETLLPLLSSRETLSILEKDVALSNAAESQSSYSVTERYDLAREVFEMSATLLAGTINSELAYGLRPVVTPTAGKIKVSPSWLVGDLLTAMYAMIFQDLARPLSPRQCDNPTCQRFFLPNRKDRTHCSKRCGSLMRVRRARSK